VSSTPDAAEQGRIARAGASFVRTSERVQSEVQAARGRWSAVDVAWAAFERDKRSAGSVPERGV
jgi:hypothetical protein